MEFKILIEDEFLNKFYQDNCMLGKEHLLSIVNDFEDCKWRYAKFNDYILNNIKETALTKEERNKLFDKPSTIIRESIKKIRFTKEYSEIAEICLYGIMKDYYKAQEVVPKIFYKQNKNDYVKGADSVHIVIENKNDFSIWFGEAKFYDSMEDIKFNDIIESVEHLLDTEKLKKENSIITNLKELDSLEVEDKILIKKIKDFLSNDISIDDFKQKLHVPILILHKCSITEQAKSLHSDYINKIIEYHKERAYSYFNKQINKLKNKIYKYDIINFHLILFPIPDKEKVKLEFESITKSYKGK